MEANIIKCYCMDVFKFQQFEIHQESCGMKVGTDGVLLGAWAAGGSNILDIGSGTGLISMMMAQRFPRAEITAIDIDHEAYVQTCDNVTNSIYKDRIKVIETSLQHYVSFAGHHSFDCIVSNPPFFSDSLKNPDKKRCIARHTDTLPFFDLFRGVRELLSNDGVFSAIIPADYLERFVSESYVSGLFVCHKLAIKTVPRKPVKRYLLSFSMQRPETCITCGVDIMKPDGKYSEWYMNLTDSFYMK